MTMVRLKMRRVGVGVVVGSCRVIYGDSVVPVDDP